jgi:hypothetical protein
MAPAMLLLLSILLGLCEDDLPSQQCNGNGSKQELAKKSCSLAVYLYTLHMCRAKRESTSADRLATPPTSASSRLPIYLPSYHGHASRPDSPTQMIHQLLCDSIVRYVQIHEMLLTTVRRPILSIRLRSVVEEVRFRMKSHMRYQSISVTT